MNFLEGIGLVPKEVGVECLHVSRGHRPEFPDASHRNNNGERWVRAE